MSRNHASERLPTSVKNNGAPRTGRSFNEAFRKMASSAAAAVGSKWAFLLSILIVIIWAATGPIFKFSDTWQLVINTGTTIVTFLMVFLLQNTQTRDTAAIQLKLDELIRTNDKARKTMLSLEDLSEEQLDRLKSAFERLSEGHEARGSDADQGTCQTVSEEA